MNWVLGFNENNITMYAPDPNQYLGNIDANQPMHPYIVEGD
jgi:hypothetical protein